MIVKGRLKRQWQYWRRRRSGRALYSTYDREPFYDVIRPWLPKQPDALILDIGAGDGSFAEYLGLKERYPNLVLLDGNPETVALLQKRFSRVIHASLPGRLPFEDGTVSYVHCGHMIEHLHWQDVLDTLREIDRALKPGSGILAMSTPLLNEGGFFDDLTHVRPYTSDSVLDYLCHEGTNRTSSPVSGRYKILRLVNRYCSRPVGGNLGSDIAAVDWFLWLRTKILSLLKIKRYSPSGYTAVLEKLTRV